MYGACAGVGSRQLGPCFRRGGCRPPLSPLLAPQLRVPQWQTPFTLPSPECSSTQVLALPSRGSPAPLGPPPPLHVDSARIPTKAPRTPSLVLCPAVPVGVTRLHSSTHVPASSHLLSILAPPSQPAPSTAMYPATAITPIAHSVPQPPPVLQQQREGEGPNAPLPGLAGPCPPSQPPCLASQAPAQCCSPLAILTAHCPPSQAPAHSHSLLPTFASPLPGLAACCPPFERPCPGGIAEHTWFGGGDNHRLQVEGRGLHFRGAQTGLHASPFRPVRAWVREAWMGS